MKFLYKVFHSQSNLERSHLVKNVNQYMSEFCDELDTPTIEIKTENDLKDFYENNKSFKIDSNGYNLDGVQGWKLGELGIWASNYAAWNNFLKTDSDYLILMEDDIILYNNFFPLLKKYLEEIKIDWDCFSFFIPEDQIYKYNLELLISENVSKVYSDWSCLCYVLNRKGAEKALSNMNQGVNLPLDWYFYRQSDKFTTLTIKPDAELGCTLFKTESTFQNKHERKIINGIF